jgi:hypothetical protein
MDVGPPGVGFFADRLADRSLAFLTGDGEVADKGTHVHFADSSGSGGGSGSGSDADSG